MKGKPVYVQVLGHVKTILILLLGFVLFNKQVDCRQATGIVIAMVGVIAYTELKRAPISKVVPPLQIVNDEDSSLLSSPKNKDMQV
jgi:solute carrier family 35 protein E3